MKTIRLTNGTSAQRQAIEELGSELGFRLSESGLPLRIEAGDGIQIHSDEKGGSVVYDRARPSTLFREVRIFASRLGETFDVQEKAVFRDLGAMLDCSRNAVIGVDSAKKMIRLLAAMGYSSLQLYTEDTYEIEGEPWFGYLRGRFSAAELREIRECAERFGIELVPCIQTLAHLNGISRWEKYAPLFDCNDILLAGDKRTEALIEKFFQTMRENVGGTRINIGMDEAHMLGRGKYFDEHGARNRFDIMLDHLSVVTKIAKKYGYEPMMWGDMFFRLAFGGDYYVGNVSLPAEVLGRIPKDVSLIYWDYYSGEKKIYDNMIEKHKLLSEKIVFAGGAWKWVGFAPDNAFSLHVSKLALDSAVEHRVSDVFVTCWGDNGGECSPFAVLPTFCYYGERAYGNSGEGEDFNSAFRAVSGYALGSFLKLDLANRPSGETCSQSVSGKAKPLLYNDCFLGILDKTAAKGDPKLYAAAAETLESCRTGGGFDYLFDTQAALCRVLADKLGLGVRTRSLYKSGDRDKLSKLLIEYDRVYKLTEAFYRAFRAQWERDNKFFGFEVQDQRLGGLLLRIKHCRERLEEFCSGRLGRIPELEEEILGGFGSFENLAFNSWSMSVSANIL